MSPASSRSATIVAAVRSRVQIDDEPSPAPTSNDSPELFRHLRDEPYRTLCLVALKTGMRQGELIGLHWRDVDHDQAVIRVRSSFTGGVLATPKNRERRDVDLITDVVELLTRQRQAHGAQITWLSRHLGHSSLKVTTDIYGHWERAERKRQAARMEGAFPV